MRIDRLENGGEPSFRLVGRLEGGACRHLLRMLNGPVGDGSVITVDLDGLQACDADGAAALVSLVKRAREAGGAVLFTTPRASVMNELDEAGALDAMQLTSVNNITHAPRALRYLTRIGEAQPFAYAPNRRDFYLVSNDTLWAHDSHDWLLATGTGAVIAHRTRGSYYSDESGEPVFHETPAPA